MRVRLPSSFAGAVWAFVASVSALPASAGELVYTPINPSFGGNPLNSSHLLGIASSISKFKEPERQDSFRQLTPAQQFQQALHSSLLARISADIADQIYGENARNSGRFVIGTTTVSFQRQGSQTVVTIHDAVTGGETTIEIPTPNF